MTFDSKKTFANLIAGLFLYTVYIGYALSTKAPGPDNLKAWAVAMLVFIGIGIIFILIIQIILHVISAINIASSQQDYKGKHFKNIISDLMVEDEREKHVKLRFIRIWNFFAVFGFIVALVALVFGLPVLYALHIIFGAFGFATFIEELLSICYYEKGFRNG
jgi:predicted RND superfamily exporter protein